MSKQDIEKRLGFAAQGVKAEFVSGGLSPSEMKENQRRIETNIRYEAGEMRNLNSNMRFIKEEIQRLTAEINNTRDIKRKAKLSLKLDVENKRMKDQVLYLRRARQSIQENQADAKSLGITLDPKWAGNFARPGAKAEMGFLSRVGYAATALTADPADPKSPEYRKQVAEAKAAAKDAITNYKFMRDKVKERLAALDAYVTNAIKVINSATSAKDIEHYVEQLRIAVKSQSMILGASKSPFARSGVKADFAAIGPAPLRGSPARKEEIAEEKAAAVARAAARAAAIDKEKATIQRKLNTLRPRYRELADYLKAATPRIYKLNTETYTTPDMKKKAKLLRLLEKERAADREAEAAFKETAREIIELEKRARKLGMTLQASRPGVKAKFARFDTDFSSLAKQIPSQPDLAKKSIIALAKKMGKEVDITRAEFEQLMQYAAKLGMETQVANAHDDVRPGFSRTGAKAKA
jgi:hypothetical protein